MLTRAKIAKLKISILYYLLKGLFWFVIILPFIFLFNIDNWEWEPDLENIYETYPPMIVWCLKILAPYLSPIFTICLFLFLWQGLPLILLELGFIDYVHNLPDKKKSIQDSIKAEYLKPQEKESKNVSVRKLPKKYKRRKAKTASDFFSPEYIQDDVHLITKEKHATAARKQNLNAPIKDIIPKKINYLEKIKLNKKIGLAGEEFVVKIEENELLEKGYAIQASRVLHVSKEIGDGAGYDILSFDENGVEKYIEVKTTLGKKNESFYISKNEMSKLKHYDNYFIYRVYNFNLETGKGCIYKINGQEELESFFIITPKQYKVYPKRIIRKLNT